MVATIRAAWLRERVVLIQEPSWGEVLLDLCPAACALAGGLAVALLGQGISGRVEGEAEQIVLGQSCRAAELFTSAGGRAARSPFPRL